MVSKVFVSRENFIGTEKKETQLFFGQPNA